MAHRLRGHCGLDYFGGNRLPLSEDAFVFVREDLDELRNHGEPMIEQPFGAGAAGGFEVTGNVLMDKLLVLGIEDRFQRDGGLIAALIGEGAMLIENVSDAA
jgi:hypothetical protein